MELTEAKALHLLQHGSTDALQWFIRKYTPYVSTVIYNIIGSSMSISDTEEVAADVFFTLWENADKVKSGSRIWNFYSMTQSSMQTVSSVLL